MKNSIHLSELWEAVRLDDEVAYSTLHYQLYPKLYRYALRILKDSNSTDDLLQEVFIKLWNKRKQLDRIENVQAYFYQTTRFVVINHLRSIQTERNKMDQLINIDIDFSAECAIIEEEKKNALKRALTHALNDLPVRQKEILYFRYYEGLDYDQIVDITGLRYQSVVNHIYRATQSLRKRFDESPLPFC